MAYTSEGVGPDAAMPDISTEMLVREIMNTNVVTVDSQTNVLDVANKMVTYCVGSVIVTDGDHAVGIITEADIISKVVVKNVLPNTLNADFVMSSPIITIKPSTNAIEAALIMTQNNIRRLVVLEGDKMLGLLTDRDILSISPGLNTILEDLIELNKDETIFEKEESTIESGICQRCGSFADLTSINGLMLCEDCREEEGYYDN